MNHQIRRVATAMLVLFGALFVNLNRIQVVNAGDLIDNQRNRRLIVREYQIERGPIVVGDRAIAFSRETDDSLQYLRVYAEPELYAHVTGYYSFLLQRSGLEAAMNETLTGTPAGLLSENLADLLVGRDPVGNTVALTLDPRAQSTAALALGERVGAVVAMDVESGAVLVHYANPTYDPNPLTSHDAASINAAWRALLDQPDGPLVDRVTRESYPPGSVFKLVTAAAALERGITPDTAFPDEASYQPPIGQPIGNFGDGTCGDGPTISLRDALRVSCNTVFARLGVELGSDALTDTSEAFGLNRVIPYELTTVRSQIPKQLDDAAAAQSAIGQRDVRVTPLQAAMIVAAIANDGELRVPHVVDRVLDPSGRLVRGPSEGPWVDGRFGAQAISVRTAELLQELMVTVVQSGTGTNAAIPGVRVGGKTGTAQVPGETSTVWFAGFADDGDRTIAVAVMLEDAGEQATGGGQAAPIAKAVLEAVLGLR